MPGEHSNTKQALLRENESLRRRLAQAEERLRAAGPAGDSGASPATSESQALLSALFEDSNIGMAMVNPATDRYCRVNKCFCKITGYSAAELLAMTASELTHPEDRARDNEIFARVVQGESPVWSIEKRYVCKNGAIAWVKVDGALLRDGLGRPTHTSAIVQDITAHREAQAALALTSQRFEAALQTSRVMVFNQDRELRYTWVHNPSPGFDARRLLGKRDGDLMECAEDAAQAEAIKRAVLESGISQQREVSVRQGGDTRHFDLTVQPQRDAAGSIVGVTCAAVDITERKQAEQALSLAKEKAEQTSRAKDEFLAALSHELRTPLNPVLLLASEMERCADLTEAVRADFAMIRQNVELEARLIDDLLDLTGITRGKVHLASQRLDVHALLGRSLSFVRGDLQAKQLALNLELTAPGHHVSGDPVRLHQVFWNVLKNAVKFTPQGGSISLCTRAGAGREILIEISDTGLGIEDHEIERIFNAFDQGDHARSHRFGGLGLGLAICKLLVQLHGGRICAQSAGRGHGATFRIELPLVEPGPPQEGPGLENPRLWPLAGGPEPLTSL